MWYDPLMRWLLRSPLHGVVSKSFMLVTYTGRRSGKLYETPVNYARNGDVLTVFSLRRRTWWRNLSGGAPLKVRVQGRDLEATGHVVTDTKGVAANLQAYLQQNPRIAKYFHVSIDGAGMANGVEVANAAQDRVVIRLALAKPSS